MIYLLGTVLNNKQVKTDKSTFMIYQILDQNKRYSRVVDVADFEDFLAGTEGAEIKVPVSIKVNKSDKGGVFMNFSAVGKGESVPQAGK